MKAPAGLAEAARSGFFWLEITVALLVGVCFTLGRFGGGWALVGAWALIVAGDVATRPAIGDRADGDHPGGAR